MRQVGIANVPDIIAMILLPVAVLMCGYALMVFLWRGSQIARKQASFAVSRLVIRLRCTVCLIFAAVKRRRHNDIAGFPCSKAHVHSA